MDHAVLLRVAEALARRACQGPVYALPSHKVSPELSQLVEQRMAFGQKEATLYEKVIEYIRRQSNPAFFRKNGEIKEAGFYKYACIDKSTWSELRWNLVVPKKKTLLKLVIALQLNEEEATDLMWRGSSSFNPKDLRDQIILALIDIRCYDPDTVYEVLEEYRLHGGQKIENIYD